MRIVPAAGFLVLLASFVGLGFWQLDRAAEKRELFATFEAGDAGAALTALIAGDAAAEHRYRTLELDGEYLSSRQILLDWMTHEGRVGYQVLTPFRPSHGDDWVVVNRGWLEGSPGHGTLPDVAVDERRRTIRGRIDALPRPGLRLRRGAEPPAESWPRALLYPTLAEIEAELGVPIAAYQLLLDADDADGFVREWRPRSLPPENHVGYAVQWFGFAAVLAALALGVWIKNVHRGNAGP